MKRTRRRVEKEDYARILLTETATYDVPIIFSNLGFYWHVKKFAEKKSFFPSLMKKLFSTTDLSDYSIPYTYKIRKNFNSYRSVSLIHPRSQLSFIDFYKEFDSQILLACQKSEFSLRYPARVGSKYYSPNANENRNKYKSRAASTVEFESRSKHLSTYFSYSSHIRLHNFFDSADYFRLEKRYTTFWSLDVMRCFDSVYTHSITWALKTKEFSKINRSVTNSFGSIFDRLMQSTNYNETAGIVIGSEVSRIFAEIIFQRIDKNIEKVLSAQKIINEEHYTIRRYVDDIFVFANSDEIAARVLSATSDALKEYKFSINDSKTIKAIRPFITEQSRAIRAVKLVYSRFTDKLLQPDPLTDSSCRVPKPIFNRRRLVISSLQEIESVCFGSPENYSLVSAYLVSTLSNLLISFINENSGFCPWLKKEITNYANFFHVVIDLIFALYTVNPSQSGSIKIAILIEASCNYFEAHIPNESNAVRSQFYTLACDFFESSTFRTTSKDDNNTATIETLNLLSAIRTLGNNFIVSRSVIEKIVSFSDNGHLTYFETITLLFYIGNDENKSFTGIRGKIKKSINFMLSDLTDLKENSEKLYVLLDSISCPYLDEDFRTKISKRLWKFCEGTEPTAAELLTFTYSLARYPWFTSWTTAEAINSLEKKALLVSY